MRSCPPPPALIVAPPPPGARFSKSQAALAQLVEHIIRNDGVRCSSHLSGTTLSRKSETGTARGAGRPDLLREFRDLRSCVSGLLRTETFLARRIAGE